MKKLFLFSIGLIFLVFCLIIFFNKPAPPKFQQNSDLTIVQIGNKEVFVTVSDTQAKREQGLSGRNGLSENEGMLFVFDTPNFYGTWMKDMNFPIDIAWIDENKKIISIESQVSPASFPKVFYPDSPALYVVELPSGFFESNSIDTGAIVSW